MLRELLERMASVAAFSGLSHLLLAAERRQEERSAARHEGYWEGVDDEREHLDLLEQERALRVMLIVDPELLIQLDKRCPGWWSDCATCEHPERCWSLHEGSRIGIRIFSGWSSRLEEQRRKR